MVNSCDKGKRGERMAAEALKPLVGTLRRTVGQNRDGGSEAPDIDSPDCPFAIEVKFGKHPNPGTAWEQSVRDAKARRDKRPSVAVTKGDRRPWLVTMELELLIRLVGRVRRGEVQCLIDTISPPAPESDELICG